MNAFLSNDPISLLPSERWWSMAMDLRKERGKRMMERYYLSEVDGEGCKRVLSDLKNEGFVPLIAVNLEQIEAILQRKEDSIRTKKLIQHQTYAPYWMIWLDAGDQVWEQWVQTFEGADAEALACERFPNSDVLLRAPYSAFLQAEQTLATLDENFLDPVWLDLRDEPNRYSSLELLLKRQDTPHVEAISEKMWVEMK